MDNIQGNTTILLYGGSDTATGLQSHATNVRVNKDDVHKTSYCETNILQKNAGLLFRNWITVS